MYRRRPDPKETKRNSRKGQSPKGVRERGFRDSCCHKRGRDAVKKELELQYKGGSGGKRVEEGKVLKKKKRPI